MILIVSALFPPEPVVSANLSFDIANALVEKDEVVVISPKPSRPLGMTFDDNNVPYKFKHILLNSYTHPKSHLIGRFIESYSLGIHTKKYIDVHHQDIEVIYANTWPLFAQKYLVEVASKYKIPLVLHVQDIYPESISEKTPFFGSLINKLLLPMDKNILKHSSAIITISYKMRDYLINSRHLEEDKISVVRNWQDDDIFINFKNKNKNQLNKDKKFTFMYLGSISPSAGVDLLVHAFSKADLEDAQLIIAGGGSDKEKCMKIAKTYKDKDIQFYEVSGVEVPAMQARADVLMLPLKKGVAKTALPSKLTAYMLSGKPVIASIDVDSEPADIIRDNGCGFAIEPENEKELINCMEEIFRKNRDELLKMGEQSFNYAKENLSRKYNLSKIIKIIKNAKREAN